MSESWRDKGGERENVPVQLYVNGHFPFVSEVHGLSVAATRE